MHQDIEDSLAASSICHAGGPQSPARSAENLLNGHRTKGLLELRRDESNAGASGAPAPVSGPPRAGATAPTPSTSSAKQRSCLFRVEEDEEEEEDPSPLSTQVILRRRAPSITNRLTSRKSAPLLNQIFEEEGESDDDFHMDEGLPPKLSRLKMNIAAAGSPGTTQKRYHRRKSQGRGSSCSSSETSDDDSESHRRRLDKDTGFTYSWNRRDSSEGPPGNSGGNGGGSSGGQSKPPGEGGSSGPDRGGPPGGGGGGSSDNGGSGSSGGGGGNGQGSPSSCSNGSSNHSSSGSTRRHCASRSPGAAELVESLKLLSLCLSSQLQHRGRSGGPGLAGGMGQFIIHPQNLSSSLSAGSVKTQERSSWKMCIGSNGSLDLELDTIALPTTAVNTPRAYTDQTAAALSELALATKENNKLNNLKKNVLQLPLCEKTISVNIQRSPREGLLCTSQASCCQVI